LGGLRLLGLEENSGELLNLVWVKGLLMGEGVLQRIKLAGFDLLIDSAWGAGGQACIRNVHDGRAAFRAGKQ
jgi:hypothetical protein